MSQFGILTEKTLTELREMNLDQVMSAQAQALAGKSKEWRIEFELQQTEFADPTTGEDSPNGQVWRQTVIRRAEGKIIRRETAKWTYYPTGEVDIITISELDPQDQIVSQKKIKHFTNGRQPIVLI